MSSKEFYCQFYRIMLRRSISRVGIWKRSCSSAGVPIDKALRSDVKMLGNQLGEVIKAEREDVFLAVEKLRKLGREVILLI